MKIAALTVPLAALALAACSDRVEDHAERTGNAIAADVARAGDNVVDSVDALTGAVQNHVDGVAVHSLDRAANHIDAASKHLEAEIRARGDTARDRAGAALEEAGNDLRDRTGRNGR